MKEGKKKKKVRSSKHNLKKPSKNYDLEPWIENREREDEVDNLEMAAQ